jgi:diacylglycerol kinase family enzyme
MRALLVVNPNATGGTRRARDVLVGGLRTGFAITEAVTDYRGHAIGLASRAAEQGADVVIALGGDGTVNEVVNGLLASGPDPALPRLAVVPCGFANIFARALGLPNDPVAAAARVVRGLAEGRDRAVSMGLAGERYFTFCAGLGFDATVVRRVDARRAAGRRSSGALYVATALREYALRPGRRSVQGTLHLPDGRSLPGVALVIVTNTSPWTYLGPRALTPTPLAGFDTALDVFAITDFRPLPALRSAARLLAGSRRFADPRWSSSYHDLRAFEVRTAQPADVQLDGEYIAERRELRFRAVPEALRVVVGAQA